MAWAQWKREWFLIIGREIWSKEAVHDVRQGVNDFVRKLRNT